METAICGNPMVYRIGVVGNPRLYKMWIDDVNPKDRSLFKNLYEPTHCQGCKFSAVIKLDADSIWGEVLQETYAYALKRIVK